MKFFDRKLALVLSVSICVHLWLIPAAAPGQVRPVNDYGALGLGHLLSRLQTTASVMMIGAHPDDEDSALLAYLARGENARTAYLSLTRGDGGQNIIGPELGEALGIIRTEELLQARRLDGAEQYFTRAYDYGFSKTLAEAKSKWPEDIIKCDVVRAIRLFRPMVVISRFTGTPADGHGHHQYAGYITPIAVKAAADPGQCWESGVWPWQVSKFYVEQSFGDTSQPTIRVNTGQPDKLLGRTYFEIAMEGRSMHRSQGEGRIEFHGDQFSGLKLIDSKVGMSDREDSIFDRIDTSIPGLSRTFYSYAPDFEPEELTNAQQLAKSALSQYQPTNPQAILPTLLKGYQAIAHAQQSAKTLALKVDESGRFLRYANIEGELDRKKAEFSAAIRYAASISIDALVDKETVDPGGEILASVKAYFPKSNSLSVKNVSLATPAGWKVSTSEEPKGSGQGAGRRETANASGYFIVRIPDNAEPTQPYWLEKKRDGDLYQWNRDIPRYLPFRAPLLRGSVTISIDGTDVYFDQPAQFRFADPARGEVRRELDVVPRLSIGIDEKLLLFPAVSKARTRALNIGLTRNSCREWHTTGTIRVNILDPSDRYVDGWKPTSDRKELELRPCGEKTNVPYTFFVPTKTATGTYVIEAQTSGDDFDYTDTMNVVAYPHIQTHRYYTPADTKVVVLDLKTVPLKVGYIMGSGDEVPEAIRQMGMDVTMLEEKDLASGDLSKFDTIVVGIRASETRPDLVANNARVLDYVKNGGTVVMQYQRFAWTGLAPYPVDTQDKQGTTAGSIARVVDENAPVKILDPAHPVFNFPNKITDADFSGWVQERNAYNLVTFDPQYMPLLESHDAGEQENKGGLVVAKVGKGNWVYCSYSFFRQLPAGVPGAYRLFANLLSLPKAK